MSYEATLIFTEPLLRKAVFAFWHRSVGVSFIVALLVVAMCLGLFLAHGDTSWIVGVLATTLFIGVAFAVALYFIHYCASLRKFHAMGSPQATFRADELTFTIISGIGTATFDWSIVKELWRFSEVWLLLYSPAQFSTLPLACLSSEMQSFILERVRAAGGKITG